ncbi:MAG TPA: glycosyltransferase family 4 protein [Opitutaceae bacterium]|nr:glycosyltransferase family 4 protein [Opitutaceae bacterium]
MSPAGPLEAVILNDYATTTGGSTAVALGSAVALAERGVRVTLFTCVGPVSPSLRGIPNLDVICLRQQEIARDGNRLRAFAGGLRNRTAELALRDLLAGKDPARTVVHVHTWTKALSPFAPAAAASLGFPLVVTLHDFFIACPSGGFFVHRTGELCRRRPLSGACIACNCDRRNYAHKLWRCARTLLQNRLRLPERAACFVGVSDFSLKVLRPFLPAGARTRIVRNPVECERGEPAATAANRSFVFIGRFEREKGVTLFAEAARAAGVEAVFIGDGPLREEARRLCPAGTFTGWLPPAEIRRHLARARALVFPPLWYETLGLVAIEAAAAGVPAIISDQSAATDYVRDGVTGLHFERGSAASLAGQITRLARDDALAGRLGAAAYRWYWQDPWTAERHAAELHELYEELLSGAPALAADALPHPV